MSGQRPVWGGGAVDGPGWSTLLAWTGLVLGLAAGVLAITAPIGRVPAGIVWVAGFAALAVWFGGAGWLRLRRRSDAPGARVAPGASDAPGGSDASGRRSSIGAGAGLTGAVLGALVIVLMLYAWLALVVAGAGVELPTPPAWHPTGVSTTGPGEIGAELTPGDRTP